MNTGELLSYEQDMTPEKKDIFKQLQQRIIKDYGNEAAEGPRVYRFLVARDFDIKKSEEMLRNHLEWRKRLGIVSILEDYVMNEIQAKYCRMCQIGFSSDGYPVVYFDFGNSDFKGLVRSVKKSVILKGLAQSLISFEKSSIDQSKKLGRPIGKLIIILDFDNLSIKQIIDKSCVDLLLDVFFMYESNFPERLKSGFAINASTAFTIIFNIIKPVLSSQTLGKLKIFGKDGWKDELRNIMHQDDLPAFLGGKKTDQDGNPLCRNTVCFASPVPKEYYFRGSERRLRGKLNVYEYVLKKNEKVDIQANVEETESIIEWEFESERGDIAFSISLKGRDQMETILPVQRVDAHVHIETGTLQCEKAGTYTLTLDNSYSWLREKHIFCRVSVTKNNGERQFASYSTKSYK